MDNFVSNPPSRPTVAFDGDCGFCRFWVRRWQMLTGRYFAWTEYQKLQGRFPEIPERKFAEAMHLIGANGRVFAGADAVLKILAQTSRWRRFAATIAKAPLLLRITDAVYRFVAGHRTLFSRLTRLGWGDVATPSTFVIGRRLFSAGLGACFLSAFASLAVQVLGLIGRRGIMPASEFLRLVTEQLGPNAMRNVPTVFWWGSSDTTLFWACIAGALCGAALMFGYFPAGCALVCWALYLSFCSVGSPFLDFQWDTLLLEAAIVGAVFLPWSLRPAWDRISRVSAFGRWLVLWLLARLMIESAAVKLTSGDPTWRNLTALDYHFETQPLPLWTAWYAHHSPQWVHKFSVLATFVMEFVAPVGIVAPRRIRHLAALGMILLQLSILTTGNYAFFNWLTIVLCLPLLDDAVWPRSLRARWLPEGSARQTGPAWSLAAAALVASPFLLLTGWQLATTCGVGWRGPAWLRSFYADVAPFRSFNSYGLFAVMTTERPEIILEGSNDGVLWQEYEFKWKPGDVRERPRLVAPHQPRLDWQMWFAALGSIRENPFLVRLMVRLLQGSPEVIALLDRNPFPNHPPEYLRAVLYDYHFTDYGQGSAWWRREVKGLYCPPISLRDVNAPEENKAE